MEKKTVTIGGNFSFQRDLVTNVINALDAGDISECKAPDVKHVSELLENLRLLFDLSPPGWLDSLFAEHLPILIRDRLHRELDERALDFLSKLGMGEAAAEVIAARKAPNNKGHVEAMVKLTTLMTGNENKAVETVAGLMGRDIESIKRQVRRTKSRKK